MTGYALTVANFTGIFILLTLSLNVLTGYARQVSLGHAAFFGIGAYASALLATKLGLPFWAALPLAAVISALVGTFLGLPSLRVSHDFLVLATIGLNFIVVAVFTYFPFFGGSFGIVGVPPPQWGSRPLSNTGFFFLIYGLVALAVAASLYLSRTWTYLAMSALGEDEVAAQAMGVEVARFKIYAFAISSALAGIAGSLWAHYLGVIFPDNFGFERSITILSMLVFGGIGTVRGAMFGATTLYLLPELLRFIQDYRMMVYGGLLVFMITLQPMGLLGQGSVLWRLVRPLWERGDGRHELE